jgi:hypothetical protein
MHLVAVPWAQMGISGMRVGEGSALPQEDSPTQGGPGLHQCQAQTGQDSSPYARVPGQRADSQALDSPGCPLLLGENLPRSDVTLSSPTHNSSRHRVGIQGGALTGEL